MPCLWSRTPRACGGRVHTYHSRLFSTTRVLHGGSFFNLGGLGASREAQYLSREHGIPRTEYSANIHLIRSSEVDPFAPAPGSTRRVAAPQSAIQDSHDSLALRLQATKKELAQTKTALSRLQARSKGLEMAVVLVPVLIGMIGFIGYQIRLERTEKLAGPWQRLSNPLSVHAQQSVSRPHKSTQRYRDATPEEQALAESGLTSFETYPTGSTKTRTSILSGLLWARS